MEVLASKLRKRGIGGLEIVGFNGPSIKSAELGEVVSGDADRSLTVKIVDPENSKKEQAVAIQKRMISEYVPDALKLPTPYTSDEDMTKKAETAAQLSRTFYEKFIEELGNKQLLLKSIKLPNGDISDENMVRVCTVLD